METLFLFCSVVLLHCSSASPGFAGKEFAFIFMQNYKPDISQTISITIIAQQAASVKVQVPSLNFVKEDILKADQSVTIQLPIQVQLQGSMKSSNTVLLEATADVTVTSFSNMKISADTALYFPISKWGSEYFIFTPTGTPQGQFKEFSVTNGKNNNRVEMSLKGDVVYGGQSYAAGQQLVVDLKPYESLQLQSSQDLTGSRIVSQQPVGVLSGHTCNFLFGDCNHVYEQLLPVSSWGSKFIVPSLNLQRRYDSIFIQASQPTQVTIKKGNSNKVESLTGGQSLEVHNTFPDSVFIEADHGIQVLMLFNGVMRSRRRTYDSFLMTILPMNFLCSSYSLVTKSGFSNIALIVALKLKKQELRLDGLPITNLVWHDVPGTDYAFSQVVVRQEPVRIVSSSGFGFGLYGFGLVQGRSFGAPAQCRHPAVNHGICWAIGDPHYQTFDGRRFDFMGTCTYLIAKNSELNSSLPTFEISAKNENRGNLQVSYVGLVTVKIAGFTITAVKSEIGRVRVDNSLWSLPVTLDGGKLQIIQSGRSVLIQTDFGLLVRYDWIDLLVVTMPPPFAGKTSGLCGNFNGDPNDDLTTPEGTQAAGELAFAASWKVPGLESGVQIQDWRKHAKCPYECPANSTYEQCGSACPATCSSPNAPSKCSLPCVETCTCNKGFVLIGGECQPAENCGCVHEGRYMAPGQSSWAEDSCQQRCTCVADSRSVQCQDVTCRPGTVCQVLKGIRDCHPISYSTCHARGDPHFVTFDKKRFDFQGTCLYQMVKHSAVSDLEAFEVLVQNDHRGNSQVSFAKLVEVKIYSLSIVLSRTYKDLVMVNGELANLPVYLAEGRVCVHKSGLYAVVSTTFGLKVYFDWNSAVSVTLPSNYIGQDPEGPFRDCHTKVDPADYFEDCVYDVCVFEGQRDMLCQAITSYSSACQAVGATVYSWRTTQFCEVKCPLNSLYEVCATGCPATCQSIFTPQGCEEPCREGCSCKDGFILSGELCVALSQCGCVHKNRYYKTHQLFYPDGKCDQECKCLLDGEVEYPCKSTTCSVGEECVIQEDQGVCVPTSNATCWAWGDPHYHTFDGYNYDFQGTCKYIYSMTCGELGGLTPFSISEQNGNRGSAVTSYVKEVALSVYGFNITVRMNQVGQVLVNGELVNVPFQLGKGKVIVSYYSDSALIVTDFGLRLLFDWNWKVDLHMPSTYQGRLCGLCGNYNGKTDDELQTQEGKAVSVVEEWGKSWMTSDQDTHCWNGCETCSPCVEDESKVYEGETLCGALVNTAGVFSACHGKVEPQTFMRSCVYDMCLNKGDRKLLCLAMASYADQCHQKGIHIDDWREKFSCQMNCQPHSHYIYSSPCQPSCPSPEQLQTCPGSVETCECDSGYVLSAGVCVLLAECGCSYQDRYYKLGESFWADGSCQSLCECQSSHQVVCRDASCTAGESCGVLDGTRACRPVFFATCVASGDLHYRTFDGRRFDFQGSGVYQLAALGSGGGTLTSFNVTVQNQQRGCTEVSSTRAVHLEIYGLQVTMSQEHPLEVMLDGVLVSLPFSSNGRLTVHRSGWTVVVQSISGITLTFDWNVVRLTVPSSCQGRVSGLCGNYNDQPEDDMTMKDGQTAPTPDRLGWSWLVLGLPTDPRQNVESCSESQRDVYKDRRYCGIIADGDGPFRSCHSQLDPATYLEECTYDACHQQGHQSSVCRAVAAYASACQILGVSPCLWRSDTFCPAVCPANSRYSLCAPACPVTCAKSSCVSSRPCTEGCVCDDGFLQSGHNCVPLGQCGCTYSGKYYRKGEVFYHEAGCGVECRCGENGAVSCQRSSCGPVEACQVVHAIKGCHPSEQAKCVSSGDSHFISLDGRSFDFQVTCAYTLAQVSGDMEGRGPIFTVTQRNEKGGNGNNTKTVSVEVYGYNMQLKGGVMWTVTVNDELMNLPVTLGDGQIRIDQEGGHIVLQTDFGLRVLYDSVYYLEVTVPSTYQGKMSGLCGNYNKDPADDFRLPNGTEAKSPEDFGKAWLADVPGKVCEGCETDCPVCAPTKSSEFGQIGWCGRITDPKGPFEPCHSTVDPKAYFHHCVSDLCMMIGSREALCSSMQAYASACHSAGAQPQPWRTSDYCPLECPAHSSYIQSGGCAGACASVLSLRNSGSGFEGCQCDGLLVWDGGKCVQMENCGCMLNGQYLSVGQAVVSRNCGSICECHWSGIIRCDALTCPSDQVCTLRDGVRGCHVKQGQCKVSSSGLLTTFDGASGAMGSLGAFEVASLCDDAANLWFRVVVDLRACRQDGGQDGSPGVVMLYVFFRDFTIAVSRQYATWVNGRRVGLPITVADKLSVTMGTDGVTVDKASSVTVKFSTSQEVIVTVGNHLAGQVCGACGDYNSDAENDLKLASGGVADKVSLMVASWRAEDFSTWWVLSCCLHIV
ncbi:hypothetical protein NHX12_001865 [Muraenolepis orangiensis]|uniref:VWFD domain-containing protein n=1 Tax=Muraenolepis orangiensis TaxID=630683 RepID=A0A9Q0E3U6_9TELE|nr:hypothetical protein NHX12_001865 [Muraenolepis orangiensis]